MNTLDPQLESFWSVLTLSNSHLKQCEVNLHSLSHNGFTTLWKKFACLFKKDEANQKQLGSKIWMLESCGPVLYFDHFLLCRTSQVLWKSNDLGNESKKTSSSSCSPVANSLCSSALCCVALLSVPGFMNSAGTGLRTDCWDNICSVSITLIRTNIDADWFYFMKNNAIYSS